MFSQPEGTCANAGSAKPSPASATASFRVAYRRIIRSALVPSPTPAPASRAFP